MLKKTYDFKEVEKKWQRFWEKEGVFKFDPKSSKPIFSIDTPPPTISGKMHLGHAFSYSHFDFVARYQRMKGKNVLCPFGTDDNGLATIRLVEKLNGVKGTEMSREAFTKLVLRTLEEIRPKYIKDWKSIGMSCDFSIYYTTINEHCQRISQWSFIDLYKKGRIYRKRTPFLWCPECQTSIAQVELKDEEKESKFVYMRFDTSIGEPIVIATTRPELLPACVMVHVHPDDKRYRKFIGAKAKLPFFDREVDIIANRDVDPNFGSGAVYHCTFGDMDDVEWMFKYGVKPIEILNKDGTLNENAGKYKGMTVRQARKAIIEDLKKEGRIVKIEPIKHAVHVHERCGAEIEILMTEQWFIKYLDIKDKLIEAGKKMKWFPPHMRARYDNWIEGLKWDWNISRQRKFGVPVPVWFCKKCGETILPDEDDLPVDPTKDKPKKPCPKCGSRTFRPDPDVLDTWATSSLTPQIVAEMFRDQGLYNKIFPMSLRPQAHDIITFWLFNTVVKSQLHFGKNPWKDIMISGWALDPKGRKMSKSLGNIIEPQTIIKKYGADALRFWAASPKLGEDMPYQEKDIITGKKFVTKLWNASKFTTHHLKGYNHVKPEKLTEIDKWMLTKLNDLVRLATDAFEKYEFFKVKVETEKFFWHVFCDNYLEIIKPRLYNREKYAKYEILSAKYTLYTSLLTTLKLMAPITPHITEEIYQSYFRKKEGYKSIHISPWPEYDTSVVDRKAERAGDIAVDIIARVRKFKSENHMSLAQPIRRLVIASEEVRPVLQAIKDTLKADEIKIGKAKGFETELFKIQIYIEK